MQNSYFVLDVEDPEIGYRARLVYTRDYPLRSWMTGESFDRKPPEPIILSMRGTDEDDWVMGDLWLTPIAVMSKRLHEVLLQAGVDNLETYSVALHDPEDGKVYQNFLAFNLIGKIAVTDAAKTQFSPGSKARMTSADIDSLVIAQRKPGGALMFRLAESVNTILVHESVKRMIETARIDTLTFIDLEDWAS
jgi:hypothetical protein